MIPAYPAFIERKQPGLRMAANDYFDLMMRLGVRVRPERLKTLEELEELERMKNGRRA